MSATAQPALRGVVRDRQPVDAAAHDEHVERAGGEAIDVADHELPSYIGAIVTGPKRSGSVAKSR